MSDVFVGTIQRVHVTFFGADCCAIDWDFLRSSARFLSRSISSLRIFALSSFTDFSFYKVSDDKTVGCHAPPQFLLVLLVLVALGISLLDHLGGRKGSYPVSKTTHYANNSRLRYRGVRHSDSEITLCAHPFRAALCSV